jgi:acyl transferase domain-containing protein
VTAFESEVSGTDIAIVGMSGRFPGAADVAELWANIRAGRSGMTRFTDDELRAAGVPEQLLADPAYVKVGGVIEGIEDFDAGFFGVGPKEAQILDPQQRLFLEHSWQALEDAGCDPARFDGSVGVFGGSAWSSYLQNNLAPSGIAAQMGELALGLANDKDSLTTRVAHTLGLTGPAYSVQSYCSTSLVAVCAAATSLANFECDLALAGGVNIAVPHRVGYLYQQGGIAPPDGECRAFDAAGLGAPVGSGVGVVALRRLEDALADGDRVYAVIRGWAVNNDGGRKVGFTAPGVQGQAAVIAEALSSADLSAADIDYVEAHGTGTALGDASELAALQQVFQGESTLIGSVKTNVGHLDRAAGVTGLIKAALGLRTGEIPPTRNLTEPNRQLKTGAAQLEVVTELRAWPSRPGRLRRAGVSAFGIGGTNAHVVLEEAPPVGRPQPAPRPELLVWSARSAPAVDELTTALAGHLAGTADRLADVAHTLQSGRRVFEHRRVLVATDTATASADLRAGTVLTATDSRADRPVGLLFAGTGEQYPGMAADLYATEPTFRAALDECRTLLRERIGVDPLADALGERGSAASLAALLGRDSAADSPAEATRLLQPATFAIGYAVGRLLLSWGVQPAVLAGYSVGEYVAACLAGVLTLPDALALVAYRASLIDALPAGAMAAVPLGEDDLRARIAASGADDLDVAAVNGPALTVVAGPVESVRRFREALEADGVPSRPLATSHAFHSRMLEPVRAELTAWIAAHIPLNPPAVPYVSNVTGALATAEQVTDPAYWAEHMCAPVRFDAVVATLLGYSDAALLEVGPGQSLSAMVRGHRQCPQERWRLVIPTLPAAADPRPAGTVLAEALGRLWLAGVPFDWAAYQGERPVGKVGLPGYPFQRARYWIDPPAGHTPVSGTAGLLEALAHTGHDNASPHNGSAGQHGTTADNGDVGQAGGPIPAKQIGGVAFGGAGCAASPLPTTTAPRADHVSLLSPQWTVNDLTGEKVEGSCAVLVAAVDQLATAVVDRLAAAGIGAVLVTDTDTDTGNGNGNGADRAALAGQLLATGAATVVDLRAVQRPDGGADDGLLLPVAGLLDALGSDGARNFRVLLVTKGGQSVRPGERPYPAHAAVGPLPVVAGQEYLNLTVRLVDVDPAGDPESTAAALVAEAATAAPDVHAAYRGSGRYVRSYVPAEPAGASVTIRPGGAYLVTGGLGDVGLLIAGHLADSGAGRLVLTSRSGLAADPAALAALRERVEVQVGAVDVTDAGQMRTLLADAGRLDGVVHAAAQTSPDTFRPLRDLDAATIGGHFGAKVGGARVLATVLAELPEPPDFCLVFASTSALLGGLAFGSYAAANAALTAVAANAATQATAGTATGAAAANGAADAALTVAAGDDAQPAGKARKARKGKERNATRWISASWDTWAGTLARVEGGFGASMAAHSMTTLEGLAAFDRLLELAAADVVVAAGGLTDRLPSLAPAAPVAAGSVTRFPRPDLPQPYTPPLSATERALTEVWSEVLGVEPVGTRDNFFDLSGNSLLALQMLALVKQRFGVAVPSVTLFEAPTVYALAKVLDDLGAAVPAQAGAPVIAGTPIPAATPRAAAARPVTDLDVDNRIAVIGMSGRFPGAGDVAEFWRNLRGGVESISFFSEEELLASGVDPAQIHDPNYVPARPVLADVAGFDAAFFGISPRMAALTDPQQRLFLEVCWEALEQAGYAAPEERGRVGVYGGANISTYLLGMPEETIVNGDVSTYEIIMGNDKDALTTTVSYLFDLYGPSVAVQTFCSTSLVATHLAVRSLRSGECEMAIAGGVSIRVPQKVGHVFGPGGMESPDGHVRTFDAQARGSMFGDGAAVVVLKRLADAVRDGDHIWSVIRGSAMNNDGALKVGYTAPSVVGQARVVEDAHVDARVTGDDISYIEAHGTATELGDPIEVAALTRAFGPTSEKQYCPIGSVKTNIGHLDRAAGVTGLIKTSLALTDQVIPPSLHYTSPNPDIDFAGSPFYVNTELAPWRTRDGRTPIAGINSLGMGGTNVHVVVEQAPRREFPDTPDTSGRRYHVVPVSARNATAVDASVQRLAAHLRDNPQVRLADVAYTLQAGRKTFEHRRALVAGSTAEAAGTLAGDQPGALLSRVDTVRGRPVALLFAGVGEQYPGLAGELYSRERVFREALDECLAVLAPLLPGVDLLDLLTGARTGGPDLATLLGRGTGTTDPRAAQLERTEVVQPALFAVEYALARTLSAWGVQPRAMLGYSLGEYVAACLAGVLSLPDALALVAKRAQLIAGLSAGAMLAVSLPVDELTRRFDPAAHGLDVAAVNGPQVTVVAGPTDVVEAYAALLRENDVAARPLSTTHAFHSRMLAPVADELTAWVAGNVTLNAPALPYLSNVTGGYADAALVTDPGYWAAHMCGTVRFADGVAALLADPELAVVEIGPGLSLGALMRGSCPPQRWPMILSALPAAGDSRPDDATVTDCLARLWLLGVDLDWVSYHDRRSDAPAADAPGRIPLPTYPFQRQSYWVQGRARGVAAKATDGLPQPGEAPTPATLEAIAGLPKLPEEEWLFLPVWRQTAPPAAAPVQPASWLVFAHDDGPVPAALRDGQTTIDLVRPGDAFSAGPDGYTVRPGSVEDTLALLRHLRAAGHPLQRVLHLWALSGADGETVLAQGVHTLVALARAAGELGLTGWHLDVAVAGTQQVLGGDATDPYAATLTGPCRVIPLEYPTVTTRLVDLPADSTGDPAALRALVAELRRDPADPLVALRLGRRWLPEYATLPAPSTVDEVPLRDGGVYLVTGGLGGIALAMAEQLARDCAAKLVLLARTGLPARAEWPAILADSAGVDPAVRERVAKVSALLDLGAEVEIVVGDTSSPDDVRRAYEVARDKFGALHGVLHVAGVPGMGLMQFKRPEELDAVLAPKLGGALAITEALRVGKPDEVELDFLVFFSSITSTTGGGPGQVDYCAGNAFLDTYAYSLAAGGRRVLSVNWGEWTWNAWSAGLAGYADSLQEFFTANRARIGIGFDDGWRSLRRALATGEPRVVVSTQDFPTMVRFSSHFTVEAVTSPALAPDAGTRHPRPELVTSYQEPAGVTEETIAGVWCEALRLEKVGVADNFFELGGNSLLGVNIVAALRSAFELDELPPHILYEAPTVAALALVVEGAANGGTAPASDGDGDSQVRAQLRRSGLEAAGRRRSR